MLGRELLCVCGRGWERGELSRERCSDGATQVFEVFFVNPRRSATDTHSRRPHLHDTITRRQHLHARRYARRLPHEHELTAASPLRNQSHQPHQTYGARTPDAFLVWAKPRSQLHHRRVRWPHSSKGLCADPPARRRDDVLNSRRRPRGGPWCMRRYYCRLLFVCGAPRAGGRG